MDTLDRKRFTETLYHAKINGKAVYCNQAVVARLQFYVAKRKKLEPICAEVYLRIQHADRREYLYQSEQRGLKLSTTRTITTCNFRSTHAK